MRKPPALNSGSPHAAGHDPEATERRPCVTGLLAGRVALVTGGTRGIGAAVAVAFADSGADVALNYSDGDEIPEAMLRAIRGRGVRAVAFQADPAVPRQVRGLISNVVGSLGGLDVLVNTSACLVTGGVDDPDSDFPRLDQQMAARIGGAIGAIRAAARVMRRGGRIITLGSAFADRVGSPGLADYAAASAALVGYSRGAARDLGPAGITVNVVQAGEVVLATDRSEASLAEAQGVSKALASCGRPEEIAAGIVFMASAGPSSTPARC